MLSEKQISSFSMAVLGSISVRKFEFTQKSINFLKSDHETCNTFITPAVLRWHAAAITKRPASWQIGSHQCELNGRIPWGDWSNTRDMFMCGLTGTRWRIFSTKSFRFASRISKSTSLSSLRPAVRAYPSSRTLSFLVDGVAYSFRCESANMAWAPVELSTLILSILSGECWNIKIRYLSWCLVCPFQAFLAPKQTKQTIAGRVRGSKGKETIHTRVHGPYKRLNLLCLVSLLSLRRMWMLHWPTQRDHMVFLKTEKVTFPQKDIATNNCDFCGYLRITIFFVSLLCFQLFLFIIDVALISILFHQIRLSLVLEMSSTNSHIYVHKEEAHRHKRCLATP